jgi:hypothetical protein
MWPRTRLVSDGRKRRQRLQVELPQIVRLQAIEQNAGRGATDPEHLFDKRGVVLFDVGAHVQLDARGELPPTPARRLRPSLDPAGGGFGSASAAGRVERAWFSRPEM